MRKESYKVICSSYPADHKLGSELKYSKSNAPFHSVTAGISFSKYAMVYGEIFSKIGNKAISIILKLFSLWLLI